MSDLSFIACILFANVNFTHVKNTRHWKSALMGLHMRTIGIILVPNAAILVVSATVGSRGPTKRSGDENGIT